MPSGGAVPGVQVPAGRGRRDAPPAAGLPGGQGGRFAQAYHPGYVCKGPRQRGISHMKMFPYTNLLIRIFLTNMFPFICPRVCICLTFSA